jgi:hypothetical protein
MNREQAKILAPIVAAFAAGSTIEVRNNQTMFNWRKIEDVFDMEAYLRAGWEFRIAPKPQKKQIFNIALFNTAEQGKWNPAYVLVPKRHANTTKRSNGFIRWLAEDIELKRNETGVKAQEVRHA